MLLDATEKEVEQAIEGVRGILIQPHSLRNTGHIRDRDGSTGGLFALKSPVNHSSEHHAVRYVPHGIRDLGTETSAQDEWQVNADKPAISECDILGNEHQVHLLDLVTQSIFQAFAQTFYSSLRSDYEKGEKRIGSGRLLRPAQSVV